MNRAYLGALLALALTGSSACTLELRSVGLTRGNDTSVVSESFRGSVSLNNCGYAPSPYARALPFADGLDYSCAHAAKRHTP